MSHERRALVAFLALVVLATALALLLRPGAEGARAVPATATLALGRAEAARVCASVPLYPLAERSARRPRPALLRAVNATPGVPLVTRMEPFTLGTRMWLGAEGVPTAFWFYRRELRPIGFRAMPPWVREAIGVRATGPVDSPPLLYVGGGGAVLLQGRPGGEVRLTLFCGAALA